MTTIKMNDGLTRYIAKENYTCIKELIWDANLRGEKIIEITDIKEGNVLINIDSIFTVEEIRNGKIIYVGHVPFEYQLKETEFFQKLPNENGRHN